MRILKIINLLIVLFLFFTFLSSNTLAVNITIAHEWYRYQGAADSNDQNNDCGPTCVAMAIQFVRNTNVPIRDIRNYIDHLGSGANVSELRDCLQIWGISYNLMSTGVQNVIDAVNVRNHIVICCVTMNFFTNGADFDGASSDPALNHDKYYNYAGNHFIVVKGVSDDGQWIITYDPNVFKSSPNPKYWYSDGKPKGKERYYRVSDFANAIQSGGIEILGAADLKFSTKFQSGDNIKATIDNLSIRTGPGSNLSRITRLPLESEGQVVADEKNGILVGGENWWHVQFGDKNGWCSEIGFGKANEIIYPVVTAFSVSPETINLGEKCTISYNVSNNSGEVLKRVEFLRANDAGGKPVDWVTLQNKQLGGVANDSGSFTDTPASPGIYWYGVRVINNSDNWNDEHNSNTGGSPGVFGPKSVTVVVAKPKANFNANPTSGIIPLTVQFTDQTTNNPTNWSWDFDNNGTIDSTAQNPSYTYQTPGTYSVKLIAQKVVGSDTYEDQSVKTDFIHVDGPPPTISSFTINNDSPQTSDSTVTLNITATENPTDYMASEDANFTGASWQAYTINPTYNLSVGYGDKTVYVKVKNAYGESNVLSSKIKYDCGKGDVSGDGDIKPNDALLVLKIMTDLMEPTPQQECAADINDDGVINSKDAIIILRKSAGLEAPPNTNIVSKTNIVTVSLSELCGTVGDSITSTLKVDGIQDLAGGDICITYNDLVLRAVDVISSDQNALLVSNITQPGIIHISFASSGSLNNNILAKIRFNVFADKFTPLNFKNVEFYNSNVHLIGSKIINGGFKSWAIPPKYNDLLQNFPNPFNPDTWIPYQLKEGSDVMIRIYSSMGELVRELALGHKSAGSYLNRDRAAYWNGNNDAGERVVNGVYFYSIHADGFTNVKKLIVLK